MRARARGGRDRAAKFLYLALLFFLLSLSFFFLSFFSQINAFAGIKICRALPREKGTERCLLFWKRSCLPLKVKLPSVLPLIFKVRCSIVITWNFVKLSFEENLPCRGSSTLMADSIYSYRFHAKYIDFATFRYHWDPALGK